MILLINIVLYTQEIIVLDEPENIIPNEPVVRPRPGIRAQNRIALRRNNRNVLGKLNV